MTIQIDISRHIVEQDSCSGVSCDGGWGTYAGTGCPLYEGGFNCNSYENAATAAAAYIKAYEDGQIKAGALADLRLALMEITRAVTEAEKILHKIINNQGNK